MKIGVIIPSTSRGQGWNNPQDSFLSKSLDSFKKTQSVEYTYQFYVGYDSDDEFYMREDVRNYYDVVWVPVSVPKGYVTHIWNILAKIAIDDGCDYLYQCGDDIVHEKEGWVKASIDLLLSLRNIGVTGPRDSYHSCILTQTMVHKSHVDIFGYFFPPEIPNWYCDNWISLVYPFSRISADYVSTNTGGMPRYAISDSNNLVGEIIQRDQEKLKQYKERINATY